MKQEKEYQVFYKVACRQLEDKVILNQSLFTNELFE
jgi:hypothetical protein